MQICISLILYSMLYLCWRWKGWGLMQGFKAPNLWAFYFKLPSCSSTFEISSCPKRTRNLFLESFPGCWILHPFAVVFVSATWFQKGGQLGGWATTTRSAHLTEEEGRLLTWQWELHCANGAAVSHGGECTVRSEEPVGKNEEERHVEQFFRHFILCHYNYSSLELVWSQHWGLSCCLFTRQRRCVSL